MGPERLNPAGDGPILRPSVEAKRVNDLCTSAGMVVGYRARILTWLSEGARDIAAALCAMPREQWATTPPARLGAWPALRHARYLALRETCLTLPAVRQALGTASAKPLSTTAELDELEATWDADIAVASAEDIVRGLGEARFDLLQELETAPDAVWERPVPSPVAAALVGAHAQPVQLGWLMLHARYAELEHLAAIWKVALFWDRVAPAGVAVGASGDQTAGLPLHPADRLEESH